MSFSVCVEARNTCFVSSSMEDSCKRRFRRASKVRHAEENITCAEAGKDISPFVSTDTNVFVPRLNVLTSAVDYVVFSSKTQMCLFHMAAGRLMFMDGTGAYSAPAEPPIPVHVKDEPFTVPPVEPVNESL